MASIDNSLRDMSAVSTPTTLIPSHCLMIQDWEITHQMLSCERNVCHAQIVASKDPVNFQFIFKFILHRAICHSTSIRMPKSSWFSQNCFFF